MARRRKPRDQSVGTPTQQDEAEILEEVGAELNEDGELVADEQKILEAGAVDAESVRENRRLQDIVNKKRANVKGVIFNAEDLFTKYETLLKYWPAGTLDINMRRLTGTSPITRVITSRPRSGAELYEALMAIHGQHEEAKYLVKIFDNHNKVFRGNSQITLPDTRSQQGQPPPMNYGAPQAPQGSAQPQAVSPMEGMVSTMRQMFEMFQSMQRAAAPQPQPQGFAQPQQATGPDISSVQQMFEMFQSMQRQAAPQQHQAAPQSSANPDLAWMQQMFDLFQSVQPQPQPQQRGAPQPQQPVMSNPMMAMMGVPPTQPPPGTIWVPGFGFVPLDRLMQAIGGGAPSSGPGGDGLHRPPYRAPYRPPYGAHSRDESHGYAPQQPPQKSAAEQFREALTVVRTAVEAVQDINNMLPNQVTGAPVQEDAYDDDSPVQVIDTGPAKIVVNKKDGSLRGWETGWANMDKVLKWVGEQREQIQRAQQQQQQQQRQRRVLPPGYVEVGPGYQPPPGFVAVPVEEEELPPPPAHVPAPVEPDPASTRPVWGPPTIPDEG